jgi:hypothetical protein
MHRFATQYFPEPVAVNDLGCVAYANDTYVLDLVGLGSEEARQVRQRADFGVDDMRELVEGRGVSYAMIYDTWFTGSVPPEWCRIATLRTPRISVASGEVAFYLIDRDREAEFRSALADFGPGLPAVATLSVMECDTSP